MDKIWSLHEGEGPLIAAAIHNGHHVREEVSGQLNLSETERLREEDPFTGDWTSVAETRIVVLRSRFEVDINRPRYKAAYTGPDDAWGMQVWKTGPSQKIIEYSLAQYDAFYAEILKVFKRLERRFGHFVVFDLHSYNHRRSSPEGPSAEASLNPDVNIGTGTMDRTRWAPVVERFIADLSSFNFPGRCLDVRENAKFRGGYFPRWIHENFPRSGCALAIEFKKFFMDEWTGKPDAVQLEAIQRALASTVPGVLEELMKMKNASH
jgi:N-formylglutamate amidohydrolase